MDWLKNYDLGEWAIIIAAIVFILQTLFKAFVEQSIKKRYEIKSKAVLVADLMAEWVSLPQDKRKLRQLTNEAFLWLPPDLATELSKLLSDKKDALDYRELMSRIRTHLLGDCDTFESYRFITYKLTQHEISEMNKKKNEAEEYLSSIEDKVDGKNKPSE
ncbi:hypothetical protein [Phytobacter diazotrophicus]|uniref:hypothetical protein n=1 Tax=Phytobacter diazotrophicus TaxID=395631 RepID=UPI002FFA8D11